MNKQRRNEIKKALDLITEAAEILDIARDEEYDALNNLPESLQYSERGREMEEYINIIEDFLDNLDTDRLEEIAENIN